jgi:hypothetical protein
MAVQHNPMAVQHNPMAVHGFRRGTILVARLVCGATVPLYDADGLNVRCSADQPGVRHGSFILAFPVMVCVVDELCRWKAVPTDQVVPSP